MHMTTPSPRERGRRAHRTSEEEFVLYLQGIPSHCRWQELKDFVRQTALHIRQAVVYDDQHGYPTGLGQIIVKNEDEAWRTYRKLSATGWDGHPLTVTLARASSPTRPIAGPTRSCSSSSHTLTHGGKFARHSVAGTPTPESPVTTEPIRSHSIATGTIYSQCIPPAPCTPTGYRHGPIQGFSATLMDSPGGAGHHHHSPAGWNMHADGMLTFSPPTMTMFPPPPSLEQPIEYPYYLPYSHQMQIPVRGQPMYPETSFHDYHHQQQQGASAAFLSQYPLAPNQYYHHHEQPYHLYGYDSPKPSLHSTSTSAMTATYNSETGILSHQALPQMSPMYRGIPHIIIDNIRPGVDIQTLQDHFRGAGHMLHCQIIRYNNNQNENGNEARCNESSYPGQCYATATFSSAEEAERAVGLYNGSDLGGSRVVVRLDTEWESCVVEESNVNGDGDESDWSRSQSYSLSFTTSSNAPLASSVSSSTVASMGTFSAYSESPNSQLSTIPTYHGPGYHHNHHHQQRDRRDSGKELFKNRNHSFFPSRDPSSDCVDNASSRSISPTSGGGGGNAEEEKSKIPTTIMQPLVVNGSGLVGKAKM